MSLTFTKVSVHVRTIEGLGKTGIQSNTTKMKVLFTMGKNINRHFQNKRVDEPFKTLGIDFELPTCFYFPQDICGDLCCMRPGVQIL